MKEGKMKVEIWSDVMCPFCYIGKRRFEKALEQFPKRNNVEIEWKSFQLDPDLKTDSSLNINQYLASRKSMGVNETKAMLQQVTQMAEQVGLDYNFDLAVVANSFNAHRFAQFAKTNNKQDAAEEGLFKAYFTDGKNIDDIDILIQLGIELGLDSDALKVVLQTGQYAEEVRSDIAEAKRIGVNGVPFFVFNRKMAVSGAQDSTAFLQTLEQSFAEWQNEQGIA